MLLTSWIRRQTRAAVVLIALSLATTALWIVGIATSGVVLIQYAVENAPRAGLTSLKPGPHQPHPARQAFSAGLIHITK
jgi:hypothetical protein